MKKVIGWSLFGVLFPVIVVGWVSFMLVDAARYGWLTAKDFLDDWQ